MFNWIWPGTILFFYGAFFLAGAALFTLRTRWLLTIATVAAVAGALIQWWAFERRQDGHTVAWLFSPGGHSPRGLMFDTFVNGTHPLLPWLAFFCVGIVLGRRLPLPFTWLPMIILGALGVTMITYAANAALATTPLRSVLFATDPFSRSLNYTIGTLGSSIAAFATIALISQVARNTAVIRSLAAAGRMTLTIYVLHALVFNLAVHVLGWVRPTGLDTAWLFTVAFWVPAIVLAAWWQRHLGLGPLERVYRRFGGDESAGNGIGTGAGASPGSAQSATPSSANVPSH